MCVVETNLKYSLKIEKESLIKQLFMKTQLSTFIISANLTVLQFLNKLKGAKALKGAKIHNS